MTVDRNYRSEAQAARRAARERIAEFRAQRRAKRGLAAQPSSVEAPGNATDNPYAVDPGLLFSAPTDAAKASEPTATQAAVAAAPAPVADDGPLPADTELQNADAAPSPTLSADPHTNTSGPDTPMSAFPSEQASDLATLPGAGDGMIWLFHQCGITSLADLARADADRLSQRLGIVGQILDITPWIAHAKDRTNGLG